MRLTTLLIITLMLSACSQTTTYKAKSLGWSTILEAKTISLAKSDCANHYGYYTSAQIEMWGGWNNNQNWYDSIKVTCTDGHTVLYPISIVEQHHSPLVAELLTTNKDTK